MPKWKLAGKIRGKDGKTPIKGVDYFDGKTPIKGVDYFDGINPDTKEVIEEASQVVIKALEPMIHKKEEIDIKDVKGFKEEKEEIDNKIRANKRILAGPNANAVQFVDLSSQLDGATTTFTTPTFRKALMLFGTQFPLIFRPVVDYTIGRNTLTLNTDEVSPPEAGQTLVLLYVK